MNNSKIEEQCPVIVANTLTKSYGVHYALRSFSLSVKKGDFVALLGANGAGKTTFIRIILGLSKPDAYPEGGTAHVLGCPSDTLPPRVRETIGFISDDCSPMPWATGASISNFYSGIYSRWDSTEFSNLTERWNLDTRRKLNCLSKGQKRLMEFALVLSYNPQLLIMDEPFNGLDAVNRIHLMNYIKELQNKKGITIVYTSHVLEEVSRLADKIVIMRSGAEVYRGTIAAMEKTVEETFCDCYEIDKQKI